MTPKKCNKLLQRIFQTENISCDLKTRNRENLFEKSVKKKKIFWFFSRLFLLPTVISVGVVCANQKVKPVWQLESETGCVCCWKMNPSKTTPGSDSRKQKKTKNNWNVRWGILNWVTRLTFPLCDPWLPFCLLLIPDEVVMYREVFPSCAGRVMHHSSNCSGWMWKDSRDKDSVAAWLLQ